MTGMPEQPEQSGRSSPPLGARPSGTRVAARWTELLDDTSWRARPCPAAAVGDGDREQRHRIARDLHDMVGHTMSLVCVQAGVALHLMDEGRAERVRDSLDAIKRASQDALVELRAMLGVLRQVDEPTRHDGHGLRRLGELVERLRVSGLGVQVELRIPASSALLPPSVEAAAFRIVQESLTNVVRHSDAETAVVRIAGDDGMLTVEVFDDGSPRPPLSPPGGHGIIGMRERAAALGGSLEAGPRPKRGFAVRAELPVDGAAARDERGL